MSATSSQPLKRCMRCFGPMPCEAHKNVHTLGVVSTEDTSPTVALAAAHNEDLEYVVVLGMTKDGHEFFASSVSDAVESIYVCQRAIWALNKIVDGNRDAE